MINSLQPNSPDPKRHVQVHALHLGDRINTASFDGDIVSAVPLAVRTGEAGTAVLFRYGVAVLIGLTSEEEAAFLLKIAPRIMGRLSLEEEEPEVRMTRSLRAARLRSATCPCRGC
jgi:uncharacterized Rmd1/YagE family protein